MRSRTHRLGLTIIAAVAATLIAAAPAAAAVPPPTTSPIGANLRTIVRDLPLETPDYYRTVNGVQEPVYVLGNGDTLNVPTRILNTGRTTYWVYGTDFSTLGADVFDTPGLPKREGSFANSDRWATAIGAPFDQPIGHPYTRRSMRVYENIPPQSNSRLIWPVTVDALPDDGKHHAVRFRSYATVSDPALLSTDFSERAWLIHE